MTPNTLPPCETSSASVCRKPVQPVVELLGVAVRVMAEHERDLDVVAVDDAVLRVGDRDLVLDAVAEGERAAVERRG